MVSPWIAVMPRSALLMPNAAALVWQEIVAQMISVCAGLLRLLDFVGVMRSLSGMDEDNRSLGSPIYATKRSRFRASCFFVDVFLSLFVS